MSEREAFLKALADKPDDVTTRLVYADWLDEQGEHEEADRQRKWVAAREWLVKLCHDHNPPEELDESGSYISYEELYVSYEELLALAREVIEIGDEGPLWFACRNNHALSKAIRDNESEFWKKAALVTGAVPLPEDYDPNSDCPGGGSGC